MNDYNSHCGFDFGSKSLDFHDVKMQQLKFGKQDYKDFKQISTRTINNTYSGSSLNSNSSSNGIYVDMGKVLLEAAKHGDSEKVNECVKNGAPFITDWLGTSALHIAAKNNYYDTCATLLRSGISKDAKTKVDRTPLHFAVFEGNFKICQLLIKYECSVDPLDMLQMTPLHWAIEKGFSNIAVLLLEHGASPNAISKFLKTPYSIAKEKRNEMVIEKIETMMPRDMKSENSNSHDLCKGSVKKEEVTIHKTSKVAAQKRSRVHSYDAVDLKRSKTLIKDTNNLTLQLLKEQMNMMSSENLDITSAIQSGRKIMLTEAGKRLLSDSSLNKFLKIPINTTISSSSALPLKKSVSPKTSTVTSRRMSADVLEIIRDSDSSISKNLLNNLNTRSSSEVQEVTITQRLKTLPPSLQMKNSSISLSAINVPKVKVQQKEKQEKTQLPLSLDNVTPGHKSDVNFSQYEFTNRDFLELNNNYIELKRSFEREQQKNSSLQRQLKQLESSFEAFKRQQNEKFDSILKLIISNPEREGFNEIL